jgi:K+-sensing histidine kinase KdpD
MRPPYADYAAPIASALGAVVARTLVLLLLDSQLEAQHLVIGYLVPITVIATLYGSIVAFLSAAISSVAAAYFLFPPKFSFYIADPLHIAELGFFIVLALIASKATAILTHDLKARRSRVRQIGDSG